MPGPTPPPGFVVETQPTGAPPPPPPGFQIERFTGGVAPIPGGPIDQPRAPTGAPAGQSNLTANQFQARFNAQGTQDPANVVMGVDGGPVDRTQLYNSQLSNFRQVFPQFGGMSNEQVIDAVYQDYYADEMSREEFDQRLVQPVVPTGGGGTPDNTAFDNLLQNAMQREAATQRDEDRAARPWNQKVGDWTREILQGALLGGGDEAVAYLDAARAWLSGGDFQEALNRRLEWERSQSAAFRQENPVLATGLEMGGAMATGGAGMAGANRLLANRAARATAATGVPAAAPSFTARVAGNAAAGGVGGTVYGFNTGEGGLPGEEGGLENRIQTAGAAAAPSAIVGAALPFAAPILARGTAALYNRIRYPIRGVTQPAPGVNPAQRSTQAAEFNVGLTRGQATGNVTQQADEQAILNAARGDYAQRALNQAMFSQNEAIREAAQNIGVQLSGPLSRNVGVREAGEAAIEGVRNYTQGLKTSAQAGYRRAEDLNPTFTREQAAFVPQNVASRVANGDFILDQRLHPSAFRAMDEIDRLLDTAETAMTGDVPLTQIMAVQRRLNNMSGVNNADDAALKLVRREYQRSVMDLFDAQMMSGDPAALTAWRQADQEWSRYLRMIDPETGDDAGRVVSNMIQRDVTPEEVANWLYGSNMANPPQRSVRVANLLKETLGEDSEQWNAIRSAAWNNLVTQVSNGGDDAMRPIGRVVSNIDGFLGGRGGSLANTLFNANERDLMQRYANTLRLLIPDPNATNPSRSGFTVGRLLRGIARTAVPVAAGIQGGWIGAIGALLGQPAANKTIGWMAVRRALNPNPGQPLFNDVGAASRVLTAILGTANVAVTPQLTQ